MSLCGCERPDHVIASMIPHADSGTVTCHRKCVNCGHAWHDEPTFAELFAEADKKCGPMPVLVETNPVDVFTDAARFAADVTEDEQNFLRMAAR